MFVVVLTFVPIFQLIHVFLFKINVLRCYTFFLIHYLFIFFVFGVQYNIVYCLQFNLCLGPKSPLHER